MTVSEAAPCGCWSLAAPVMEPLASGQPLPPMHEAVKSLLPGLWVMLTLMPFEGLYQMPVTSVQAPASLLQDLGLNVLLM